MADKKHAMDLNLNINNKMEKKRIVIVVGWWLLVVGCWLC